MNAQPKVFTDRSNCIRAAKKAMPGAIPSVDFHVVTVGKGFTWAPGKAPAAAAAAQKVVVKSGAITLTTDKPKKKDAAFEFRQRTGKPSDAELMKTMDPPTKDATIHADDSIIQQMLTRGEELAKEKANRTRGGKGVKKAVWAAAYAAAAEGKKPQKPLIKSDNRSNQSYQKHIDTIHELALKVARGVEKIDKLQAYQVPGTNTYAKMARRHQELWLLALVVKPQAKAA